MIGVYVCLFKRLYIKTIFGKERQITEITESVGNNLDRPLLALLAVQRKAEVERKGNELIFHLARLAVLLTRYFTARVFRYINTKYETAHQRLDLTRGKLSSGLLVLTLYPLNCILLRAYFL